MIRQVPFYTFPLPLPCSFVTIDGERINARVTTTPRTQENHDVTYQSQKNYNEDGTYTTAAATSLPVGTPAFVLCSDKNWRIALRTNEDWPFADAAKWRFADGKTRLVQGTIAAPVAMFDPRDQGVLSQIGHLIYSHGPSLVAQVVDHLIDVLVPEVPVTFAEPALIGSVAKDAEGVFWTRITPSDADGIWLASNDARRAKWKGVHAVELLPSGYDPEAATDGEAAA